ncbi:hypothetical protein ASPVEDRAFT_195898 [Aspergillus versicolor CBS 583.65]|uniref:G protein-coupled receptor GPR1/2/3 C-terminal domain-containing protein n=1 Tax=Aspergillus versicolor CBS 583.65 TaxID=1036611 RepID=A0A1L9PRC1_ASPVE|nr:uncharacterized protein ASPVEDRAFT_195898 [Aspergillus versicolor CBS 583.65]OJJ03985.1 hypothetical protein ASPVEDRAFT_195898 [Aspergillus versicolor CBS 583.65]
MATLIRTLYLLQGENVQSGLVPRAGEGPPTEVPIVGSTKAGFIAMGICGLLSFLATFSLLAFLTYRFIFWERYYKRPLARNQYVVLIYNLLLADLQQATAFLLCLHWVGQGSVYSSTAACIIQGWWIQTADPGSGLFVIAIAMHTGAVVLRGSQLPWRAFVACVIGIWAFILVLGFIPVGLYGSETFVISEAGWCWLSPEHERERLWGHYIWIFLSEFGTVVLYSFMFFFLRRRVRQTARLGPNHQASLNRLNRVVVYMVIYPVAYVILSLPLAAGRMSSARHIIPSYAYFAAAGSLMALSGLADAVIYTLTRRQLLVDTDSHASHEIYAAYSMTNNHQTHISTTRDMRKRGRMGSRVRRGLQTLNESVMDHRDDSTEEIVKKGDTEMKNMNMGQGVYQETTIEITHEDAEPEDSRARYRHE